MSSLLWRRELPPDVVAIEHLGHAMRFQQLYIVDTTACGMEERFIVLNNIRIAGVVLTWDEGDMSANSLEQSIVLGRVYGSKETLPGNADTPLPSDTDTPLPSDADTPLPSDADTPLPSDAGTPPPSDADTPLPPVADTPPPSDADTTLPCFTDTLQLRDDETPSPHYFCPGRRHRVVAETSFDIGFASVKPSPDFLCTITFNVVGLFVRLCCLFAFLWWLRA